MVFAAIVLAQMANAFEGRSTVTSLRVLGQATNRLLVGVVAVEFLALLGWSTWDDVEAARPPTG